LREPAVDGRRAAIAADYGRDRCLVGSPPSGWQSCPGHIDWDVLVVPRADKPAQGREFSGQRIEFGHRGKDDKRKVAYIASIHFYHHFRVHCLILSSVSLVRLNPPSRVLVESQPVELRGFHRLAGAPGKETDWQDDGGQGHGGDGLEDELDRFPGKPGDGRNDRLGSSRGSGGRGGHGVLLRVWYAAMYDATCRVLNGRGARRFSVPD
jgi:hypothetical protein